MVRTARYFPSLVYLQDCLVGRWESQVILVVLGEGTRTLYSEVYHHVTSTSINAVRQTINANQG
ncbi:MAG: hypothetical protein VKL59_15715 [Nostocaceae cyanobacterium]|nr:hypothetical protein [Nostocaceae cyanobacterium]